MYDKILSILSSLAVYKFYSEALQPFFGVFSIMVHVLANDIFGVVCLRICSLQQFLLNESLHFFVKIYIFRGNKIHTQKFTHTLFCKKLINHILHYSHHMVFSFSPFQQMYILFFPFITKFLFFYCLKIQ